jgi:glycosyltransferase involved in cell wall biosynthesis
MKIVHIAASLEDEAGGPAYVIPALVKYLSQNGTNASLLTVGPDGSSIEHGFPWRKFSNRWQAVPILRKLQGSSRLNAALQAERADIIHNHGLWLMPNIYGSWASSKSGCKLITSVHGMMAPGALHYSRLQKQMFGALFQNRALANSHLFHATSATEVREIRKAGWKQPIALIPLGLTIPNHGSGTEMQHSKTILYLGRIHPIKRLGDLVEVWAELAPSHPDWCVKIVGPDEGQEAARLRHMIDERSVPRIEIAKAVFGEEKSKLFCQAGLYVLPSQSENFSLTVAEALAHGVPVVCSKGAPWAGLESENCGWWYDVGIQGLKHALANALNLAPEQRILMGENGRRWMHRDFSVATMAQNMAIAYQWLLNGGTKPEFVHLHEGQNG